MNEPGIPAEDTAALLDRWLAGDLAPGGEEERTLLARDPALRAELDRHRELRARLRELPAELEPPRDLWPGVAARIAPAAGRPWWRREGTGAVLPWLALAATLAAVVGTGWLLRGPAPGAPLASRSTAPTPPVAEAPRPAPPRPPDGAAAPRPHVTSAEAPSASAGPATTAPPQAPRAPAAHRRPPAAAPPPLAAPSSAGPALAAYAETDRQLAVLRIELRRTIEAQQDRLPPATRDIVFENLATIDRALTEIEAALAAAPGDGELARTYIEYRQREIAVLRRANAMAARL
jgi:hypothetical protein